MNAFAALKPQADDQVAFFAPYLARSILELAMSSLIARCDPFRVLVVREIQAGEKYSAGERVKSALQWQGDVLPGKDDADGWKPDKEFEKFRRSLLGAHYEHLFWKKAFERLRDETPSGRGGVWFQAFSAWDVSAVMERTKAELAKVYSALSKGVHHEMLLDHAVIFDRPSICDYVKTVAQYIGILALASHLIPEWHAGLNLEDALTSFEESQRESLL